LNSAFTLAFAIFLGVFGRAITLRTFGRTFGIGIDLGIVGRRDTKAFFSLASGVISWTLFFQTLLDLRGVATLL